MLKSVLVQLPTFKETFLTIIKANIAGNKMVLHGVKLRYSH
jgi:hypothetical protein